MNVSSKKFIGLPVNSDVLGLSKEFDDSELVDAKCLLINMPIREQARPNNAPLGLCLLASRLKQFEVEVDILDLNSYRVMDEVAEQKNLENGRLRVKAQSSAIVVVLLTNISVRRLQGRNEHWMWKPKNYIL